MKNLKTLSIVTVFLIFLILLIFSFFLPPLSYQEIKRAVIVQEAYSGNVLFPTYNGIPYLTKPPLYTWVSLPFYTLGKISSNEIFFLRIFSIFCYVLLSYFIYLFWKKDFFKTFVTLFILFSSFRFLSFSFRIDLEPFFILLSFLAIYFGYIFIKTLNIKNAYLFYIFLGLSILVRGPLNFFIFPALFLYSLFFKNKNILKLIFFFKGWTLFLLIIFPWYILGYFKYGLNAFNEFLFIDLKERLYSPNKDPFYYYFKALILNFLPYFILILFKLKEVYKNLIKEKNIDEETIFFVFLFIIPTFIMSFTGEKFDKYLLYLYPFFSIFLVNILTKFYSITTLLKVSICLSLINLFILISIHLNELDVLKYKIEIVQKNLPKREKIVFFGKENPFFVYFYGKPIKVIHQEKEVLEYIEKKYTIISDRTLKGLTILKVIPDPYKKDIIWYVYGST